jgi:hypothetical protein
MELRPYNKIKPKEALEIIYKDIKKSPSATSTIEKRINNSKALEIIYKDIKKSPSATSTIEKRINNSKF